VCVTDRSPELVGIAAQRPPHSALVADTLQIPHPDGRFDFVISIAVVHHLSTPERRIEAIEAILRTLKPSHARGAPGQALVFVWALEQKNSRRGWDAGDEQDVLVPWVLKPERGSNEQPKTYQRYYHLYKAGELEENVRAAGGTVVKAGYDRDNWWTIIERTT
jgi:tRNA (uracil-5-)-methyltransferase TRM9